MPPNVRTGSQKSQGIVKVGGVAAQHLAQFVEEDQSLAQVAEYVTLPRGRIVQGMSDEALKQNYGEGAVVVRPGEALVVGVGEPFHFNPRFFFREYCKWSDRRDDDNKSIMDRSYDPQSDIAKRSSDINKRFEMYPGDEKKPPQQQRYFRYVHHLNLVGVITGDHPLTGTELTISFERGEWGNGREFLNAIASRRIEIQYENEEKPRTKQCPLWAQIWELKTSKRTNDQGEWYGFDFIPADPAVISDEATAAAKERWVELTMLHEQKRLLVDHGEPEGGDPEPVLAGAKM